MHTPEKDTDRQTVSTLSVDVNSSSQFHTPTHTRKSNKGTHPPTHPTHTQNQRTNGRRTIVSSREFKNTHRCAMGERVTRNTPS
mmetsp:Transcript_2718/g.6161  ORF Transcript_2718/g.6161 Transcript_2718/m.6161 type:complete len:84 (+) Transcript_2718:175-426(+)